jgi:stage II sporulation protein AA (anti-sigma F factor antagonist)
MNISTSFQSGRLTVYLAGELDHHEARDALHTIDELLDEYLPRDCALDLSGLSFMDSSGIAVIARTRNRMQSLNGRIWIECPSPQVQRVLDAAGIERLVPVTSGNIGGIR